MKLGVLAESSRQLKRLTKLIQHTEHELVSAILTSSPNEHELDVSNLSKADAWVACMEDHSDLADEIIHNLDIANIPVMFDDPDASRRGQEAEAERRFSMKIEACMADNRLPEGNIAKKLWVLAASAGGPEAVVEFLGAIDQKLSGVAFVYVQHINEEMLPSLIRTLKNRSTLDIHIIAHSCLAVENSLYVVSPSNKLEISGRGALLLTDNAWSGDYTPSANQIMAKVSKHYGSAAGAIVFSGMGDDGSESARLMKRAGSHIWAQSPETCTVDSMPKSVIKTGSVSFVGEPKALAERFLREFVPVDSAAGNVEDAESAETEMAIGDDSPSRVRSNQTSNSNELATSDASLIENDGSVDDGIDDTNEQSRGNQSSTRPNGLANKTIKYRIEGENLIVADGKKIRMLDNKSNKIGCETRAKKIKENLMKTKLSLQSKPHQPS